MLFMYTYVVANDFLLFIQKKKALKAKQHVNKYYTQYNTTENTIQNMFKNTIER